MHKENWLRYLVKDFIDINPTITIKKGEEYQVIFMTDVIPGKRYVFPSNSKIFKGNGAKFRNGDILFARITPCLENGKIAQVKGLENNIGFGSTEFFVFRNKNGISDLSFVYYLASSHKIRKTAEKSMRGASGRQRAKLDAISNLKISLPPLKMQEKIAYVLSNFDDLIEKNHRRIKILEEIAQLLYYEWFVEFRFPGHKDVSLIDSGIGFGEIPEGWKISTFKDYFFLDRGVSHKGKYLAAEGNPLINLKSVVPGGGYRKDGIKYYTGKYNKRQTISPGELFIINTDLTQDGVIIGNTGIVPQFDITRDILFTHHLYAIRFKENYQGFKYFFYHLINSFAFKGHAKGYASGTTVLGLSRESIWSYTFIQPSIDVLRKFEQVVGKIFDFIQKLNIKSNHLEEIRDLLLPKLISGQIDISEINILINKDEEDE